MCKAILLGLSTFFGKQFYINTFLCPMTFRWTQSGGLNLWSYFVQYIFYTHRLLKYIESSLFTKKYK